jgi:hypothetical protein
MTDQVESLTTKQVTDIIFDTRIKIIDTQDIYTGLNHSVMKQPNPTVMRVLGFMMMSLLL